jgi:Cu+-exporting ATPase
MNGSGLDSLLYVLIFGFFFYWMMKRGGCGMHSHGGHGDHGRRHGDGHAGADGGSRDAPGQATDPVCGMNVDPNRATRMRSVTDRNFYFCSPDCLAKFDADPEGFARRAPTSAAAGQHEHHQHRGS